MRIVSGKLGGRTIKAVPGNKTRPTLDKVKESVFNALGQFFSGGYVLDLYAGSGNLGLEAMSRGCSFGVFVEKDFKAIQTIKDNIQTLKLTEETKVFKMDAFKALEMFSSQDYKFDYVFLDPPYKKQKINDVLKVLEDKQLLSIDAAVVCECLKEDDLIDSYGKLSLRKTYIYGITKISIYERSG